MYHRAEHTQIAPLILARRQHIDSNLLTNAIIAITWKFLCYRKVYENEIINAEYGSVKVETEGQGLICGNICEEGACEVTG